MARTSECAHSTKEIRSARRKRGDVVGPKCRIVAHDGEPLDLSLRHQKAVERVVVVPRQIGDALGVSPPDREFDKTSSVHLPLEVLGIDLETSETAFDGDFPD